MRATIATENHVPRFAPNRSAATISTTAPMTPHMIIGLRKDKSLRVVQATSERPAKPIAVITAAPHTSPVASLTLKT